jgi:hypothetical protein
VVRAYDHPAVGHPVDVLRAVGLRRVDRDEQGVLPVDAWVVADQLLADLAGLHALAERVADVLGDVDGRLRVAEADALLVQGGQELVLRGAGVGGAGGKQAGQAERGGEGGAKPGLKN